MSPVALALLLTSAVLHAGWNLLVKGARRRLVFLWWTFAVGAIAFLPLLLASASSAPIPPRVLPYAMASALLEGLYFGSLAAAYGAGDFSVVYPVARGAAPAFLAVWSVLFLGERLRPAGLGGLGVIVCGLFAIGAGPGTSGGPAGSATARADSDGGTHGAAADPAGRGVAAPAVPPAPSSRAAVGLALLTALAISGYSAIDGAAVRLLAPAPYSALVFTLSALVSAPIVVQRHGWSAVGEEWLASWPRITAVGFLSAVAYTLVLAAFRLAPVAYAGAVREVSVVLGALAGWLLLKEGMGPRRTLGAVLVVAGIAVLAVYGR